MLRTLAVGHGSWLRQKYMEVICQDPEIAPEDAMPTTCLHAFKVLWSDQGLQTAMGKGHEYALRDNLE